MRLMTQNALSIQAPLGRIRDFITDTDPERPGTIDLKKFGARRFIDAARIFALANGVDSTNTVHRLTLASAKMKIAPGDLAPIIEGFNFIQLLRLRHQHKEQADGRAGGNDLNPDHLNALGRRTLKASLCQARSLQQRLKHDDQT